MSFGICLPTAHLFEQGLISHEHPLLLSHLPLIHGSGNALFGLSDTLSASLNLLSQGRVLRLNLFQLQSHVGLLLEVISLQKTAKVLLGNPTRSPIGKKIRREEIIALNFDKQLQKKQKRCRCDGSKGIIWKR